MIWNTWKITYEKLPCKPLTATGVRTGTAEHIDGNDIHLTSADDGYSQPTGSSTFNHTYVSRLETSTDQLFHASSDDRGASKRKSRHVEKVLRFEDPPSSSMAVPSTDHYILVRSLDSLDDDDEFRCLGWFIPIV